MKSVILAALLITTPTHMNGVEQPQMENWGLDSTNILAAHDLGYSGKGVKIAILDTGIDVTHPDLAVQGGKSFVSYTDSYNDDGGHGSYVAGLIAAKHNDIGIKGIAPDSEIYALKTNDAKKNGDINAIVNAIEWSIENQMDIIHFSWSTEVYSQELEYALNRAYQNGILIVGSAGNTNREVRYPAKFESTIAVSAMDQNFQKANFSCYGDEIEFAAPGVAMYSLDKDGQYSSSSGTSLAAAYVTGMLAILKERFPEKSNIELRNLLQSHAMDIGLEGKDPLFGYGLARVPLEELSEKDPIQPTYDRKIKVLDKTSPFNGQTLTVIQQNKDVFTILHPTKLTAVDISPQEVIYSSVQLIEINSNKAIYHNMGKLKIGEISPGKYIAHRKVGDWYRIKADSSFVWVKLE